MGYNERKTMKGIIMLKELNMKIHNHVIDNALSFNELLFTKNLRDHTAYTNTLNKLTAMKGRISDLKCGLDINSIKDIHSTLHIMILDSKISVKTIFIRMFQH